MSEEVKQDGLQEEEIQAETAETAQEEEAAEASAEEKKEMSAEDEALNMKYMRLMADFQNFKRRTESEGNGNCRVTGLKNFIGAKRLK